jgi:hypothetical protein
MAQLDKIRLSGTTYNIIDATAVHSLDGYWTTGETTNAITAATDALAESIAEQGYQTSGDVQNAITAVTNPINDTITAHTANTEIHVTVANKNAWNAKLDASDVEGFFGAVAYDSQTKRINFYNTSVEGDVLGYIDATDFIKDGMVSNVEIKNVTGKGTCIVITFNSDAGKQAIEIPITQIFDASNYYTTAQTQSYVQGYTYDKSTIDQKISQSGTFDPTQYYDTAHTYSKTEVNTLLDGKADVSTTYTKTQVDTALAGKQATLVSGTNIKTVGGTSLLGSGNVATLHASLDGETLVLSES